MVTTTRPPVLPVWADDGDKVQPSDAELQIGWPLSTTPPSRQRFNWAKNYLFTAARYIMRRGISEWSASETYMLHDRVQSSAGVVYKSLANSNTAALTDASKWSADDLATHVSQANPHTQYVRHDIAPQGLSEIAQANARANIGAEPAVYAAQSNVPTPITTTVAEKLSLPFAARTTSGMLLASVRISDEPSGAATITQANDWFLELILKDAAGAIRNSWTVVASAATTSAGFGGVTHLVSHYVVGGLIVGQQYTAVVRVRKSYATDNTHVRDARIDAVNF